MKRTWKIVLGVVGVLVVLLIVAVIVLVMTLGSIVQKGVLTIAPAATQAPVALEDVDVSLLDGRFELQGLVIGNPEGFKTESAFRLGRVRVVVDRGSLLSDRIIVREVLIDSPEITYEVGLGGSNIARIQKNVEEFAGIGAKPETEPEPEPEAPAGEGKKVQIDDFLMKDADIKLSATLMGGKALTIPLPEVHLTDIGKESGGRSISETVALIVQEVTGAILDAVKSGTDGLTKGAEAATGAIKEEASKALEGVKGIFGKSKDGQ